MKVKLPFWAFFLTLLFLCQLSWWGYMLWEQADETRLARLQTLQNELFHAEQALAEQVNAEMMPESAWEMIHSSFPQIVSHSGILQIHGDSLTQLDHRHGRKRLMILSESLVFLALAALGIGLLLKTIRRDTFLVLQQSNFLHAVTHEFRSPLHGLRLAVETIIRRPNAEKAKEYADGMLADLTRLDSMVHNVLQVGRLDARGYQAELHSVALRESVRNILQQYKKTQGLSDHVMTLADGEEVTIQADPITMTPIIQNLLSNAHKYGQEKPVTLHVQQESGWGELFVEDQGNGFSAKDRGFLFRRFWRAGDERTRTSPGVGLGLFLASELARNQGATIHAESPGVGQGATFTVRWLLAKGPAILPQSNATFS